MMYICDQCGFHAEGNEERQCPVCSDAVLIPCLNNSEVELAKAGFFLRNDTEMRREWDDVKSGETPAEAYSFCHCKPFERVSVFAGSREWAIQEAYKLYKNGIKLLRS